MTESLYQFVILISWFGNEKTVTRVPITDEAFQDALRDERFREYIKTNLRQTRDHETWAKIGDVTARSEEWWYGDDGPNAFQRNRELRKLDW